MHTGTKNATMRLGAPASRAPSSCPMQCSAWGSTFLCFEFAVIHNDAPLPPRAQEIDIQRRLDHPNIILLLDAFETPHEFCLVTGNTF